MNSFWLHPALILILGALLLPLMPARLKKAYLVLIPLKIDGFPLSVGENYPTSPG